jgi:hypothetical protein
MTLLPGCIADDLTDKSNIDAVDGTDLQARFPG